MSVHILAAMKEELQAFPRSVLDATPVGVGKVNAAIAAAKLHLTRIDGEDTILFVGTAAACDPDLEIGDVVISTDTLHHDVDVTVLGFAHGQIPFNEDWIWESDAVLRTQAVRACEDLGLKFTQGRIITGDQFVADPDRVAQLRKNFHASAIEMETAGFAQTVHQLNNSSRRLRWLGIRVISDKADKSAPVDFETFLPRASETLVRIIQNIITQRKEAT